MSRPGSATASSDLVGRGNERFREGDAAAATILYGEALALDPESALVHNNLANALQVCGRLDEAVDHYQAALRLQPDLAEAHANLGSVLHRQGHGDQAVRHLEEALRRKPGHVQAHVLLADVARARQDRETATRHLEDAVRTAPTSPLAHYKLGEVLHERRLFEAAAHCFQEAVRLKPDYVEARNNLGESLLNLGRPEESVAQHREAIALRPDDPLGHFYLGSVLGVLCRYDEGREHLTKALELAPDHLLAQLNMAVLLVGACRFEEAVACYQAVLSRDAESPAAHFGLAMLYLLRGDFERGWEEYRWRVKAKIPPRVLSEPEWEGEDLDGRTLLVHAEQGFGDAIHFARYVPRINPEGLMARCSEDSPTDGRGSRGGRVLFECYHPLVRLLRHSGFARSCEVVERIGNGPPRALFDLQAPLLGLPRVFKTRLDTIPAEVPYLRAYPPDVARWKEMLAGDAGFRVGLAWGGNPEHGRDRSRSLRLDCFAALADLPDVTFYSLQKGPPACEAASPPAGMCLVDLAHRLHDFAESAALMENLDLVISVDTSVAHLAGALDRPVWVLLHQDPEWRWMIEREDSPWYPSMRLFRQTVPEDWTDVFARVRQALREAVAEARRSRVVRRDASVADELCPALAAELFTAAGASVLDVSATRALEKHLPAGCRYDHWPLDRVPRQGPTADATLVTALDVLDGMPDEAARRFLARLRSWERPVLIGYVPSDDGAPGRAGAWSRQQLAEAVGGAGFHVATGERIPGNRMLLRLLPGRPELAPLRRVLLLDRDREPSFGDAIRRHQLQLALPSHAEVSWGTLHPWQVPDEEFDAVIVGSGGWLGPDAFPAELPALLERVPRSVGLFGVAFRSAVAEETVRAVVGRLTAWLAASQEDVLVYGRGLPNVMHFGHWLLNAVPMGEGWRGDLLRAQQDRIGALGATPGEVVRRIQSHARVAATCPDAFLCALASARSVSYVDMRKADDLQSSGRFRSILMDVFGHCPVEDRPFAVDRDAVAGYRARLQAMSAELSRLLESLTGGVRA